MDISASSYRVSVNYTCLNLCAAITALTQARHFEIGVNVCLWTWCAISNSFKYSSVCDSLYKVFCYHLSLANGRPSITEIPELCWPASSTAFGRLKGSILPWAYYICFFSIYQALLSCDAQSHILLVPHGQRPPGDQQMWHFRTEQIVMEANRAHVSRWK